MIYHIVSRTTWQQVGAGPYRADSLASEGFIHCSYQAQVARIANHFYRDHTDLLVLAIDPAQLTSAVRAEDPGSGERFPHVSGPIDVGAVVEVRALRRGATGEWEF